MTNIGRNDPCPCGSGKKYKKCCGAIIGPKSFQSEKFVIKVTINNESYKIFQIIFGKKDGSLFVNFPYYQNSEGLVSLINFPGNINLPADLSLVPGGKVTSHLVKYSHHPDGRVHFSQSGKVLTKVKKQSIPLSYMEGHIFTIKLQGLNEFVKVDQKEHTKNTDKQIILNYNFSKPPQAIKFVGRWYSRTNLIKRIKGKVTGPKVPCETDDGKKYIGFLITHPFKHIDQNYVLLLVCEEIPIIDKNRESALTFIGGFDHPDILNDLTKDTTFLALLYPASNYDELIKQIGSIDLVRN